MQYNLSENQIDNMYQVLNMNQQFHLRNLSQKKTYMSQEYIKRDVHCNTVYNNIKAAETLSQRTQSC